MTVEKVSSKNGEHRRAARRAGLRYADDGEPGIQRHRHGQGFYFLDSHGRRVRSALTLARIRGLAIPPAWTDVWISPHANDHLQATGRDAKGRKQYRYHPRWNEARSANKYDSLIDFAQALPRIRRRVAHDLRRRRLDRDKVLAAVIRLLETSLIRVGNDEYARQNHSFGLTTMHDKHAETRRGTIHFHFRAKSGIQRDLALHEPRLAKIVKRCQDLPGQQLFQYLDERGRVHDVDSTDINNYLRKVSGLDITAKDFRTWAGTALAAQALKEFEQFDSQAGAKRNVTRAIESVAKRLGNTKTICHKCYIHPAVIEAYLDKSLRKVLQSRVGSAWRQGLKGLSAEEGAVLALLQERMRKRVAPARNGHKRSPPSQKPKKERHRETIR